MKLTNADQLKADDQVLPAGGEPDTSAAVVLEILEVPAWVLA